MFQKLKYGVAIAALSLCVMGASGAKAGLVYYKSGDATAEFNNISGPNTVIPPHPVWGDVGGGAQWISYTNSGFGGVVVPNAASRATADATALFTESLGLIDNFSLKVLADDTATVVLWNLDTSTGTTLFTAFPGQIDPCAPGGSGIPVGCVNADMGVVPYTPVSSGNYELRVYAFQTNNDVFGTEYAGAVSVPEPLTLTLVATGLIAMGGIVRRKNRTT